MSPVTARPEYAVAASCQRLTLFAASPTATAHTSADSAVIGKLFISDLINFSATFFSRSPPIVCPVPRCLIDADTPSPTAHTADAAGGVLTRSNTQRRSAHAAKM
jgi:hypothetical protein